MNGLVVAFPVTPWFVTPSPALMVVLNVRYVAFFVEVMRHLLRPSYINIDLVSAAICGYFLLLETRIFLTQTLRALASAISRPRTTSPSS